MERLTKDKICQAHKLFRTDSDYPLLIEEFKKIGVSSYNFKVTNGGSVYYGIHGEVIEFPPEYDAVAISDKVSKEGVKHSLQLHHAGVTDFETFLHQLTEYGVNNWYTNLVTMKVTYYDLHRKEILSESIVPSSN